MLPLYNGQNYQINIIIKLWSQIIVLTA